MKCTAYPDGGHRSYYLRYAPELQGRVTRCACGLIRLQRDSRSEGATIPADWQEKGPR